MIVVIDGSKKVLTLQHASNSVIVFKLTEQVNRMDLIPVLPAININTSHLFYGRQLQIIRLS
jgi:hypothetical protein